MERKTILKLKEVFSHGYAWTRGCEHYSYVLNNGYNVAYIINCFGHACFNLTNKQLDNLNFNMTDYYALRNFYKYKNETKREVSEELFSFVEQAGIKVSSLSRGILKRNQTVVALYIDEKYKDIHFIKLDEYGWSSKLGITPGIKLYENVPEKISPFYEFYDSYILTNKKADGDGVPKNIVDNNPVLIL